MTAGEAAEPRASEQTSRPVTSRLEAQQIHASAGDSQQLIQQPLDEARDLERGLQDAASRRTYRVSTAAFWRGIAGAVILDCTVLFTVLITTVVVVFGMRKLA
jgi:hypothetical protein